MLKFAEDTHVQTQPVVISLAKNGVEPQPEEAGSNTNPFQVSIIPKPPELPKHPELRNKLLPRYHRKRKQIQRRGHYVIGFTNIHL